MPCRRHTLLDEVEDLIIGSDVRARESFFPDEEIELLGEGSPDLALAFQGRDSDFSVGGMAKVIRVDERQILGFVGRDRDLPTREGSYHGSHQTGVIVPVFGVLRLVVSLIAEIGVGGNMFDFGPIFGESCQSVTSLGTPI